MALAASVVLAVTVLLDVGVEETVQYPAPQAEQGREQVQAQAQPQEDATATFAIDQVTEQAPVAPSASTPLVDAESPKQSQLRERAAQRKPAEQEEARALAHERDVRTDTERKVENAAAASPAPPPTAASRAA